MPARIIRYGEHLCQKYQSQNSIFSASIDLLSILPWASLSLVKQRWTNQILLTFMKSDKGHWNENKGKDYEDSSTLFFHDFNLFKNWIKLECQSFPYVKLWFQGKFCSRNYSISFPLSHFSFNVESSLFC